MPPPFAPRQFAYAQVDVFAEAPLEGNMLAIVTDARNLSTVEMQALARETNLAETAFILPEDPATEREHGVRVRIFTTEEELAFAGHPTLGTASWLFWNHPIFMGAETITLALGVGPIEVRFPPQDATRPGVFATMCQPDPVFGALHERVAVAEALGLAVADLDPLLPIQTVSTGLPFCIVPLRSLEAIGRLAIPQARARAYLARTDAKFFYCITRADASSGAHWHSRMQFYNGEDPATGSASGCAIAFLVRYGLAPGGAPVVIEQGVEIGRPSRIHAQATPTRLGDSDESTLTNVFVSGRTIPVALGRFFLP